MRTKIRSPRVGVYSPEGARKDCRGSDSASALRKRKEAGKEREADPSEARDPETLTSGEVGVHAAADQATTWSSALGGRGWTTAPGQTGRNASRRRRGTKGCQDGARRGSEPGGRRRTDSGVGWCSKPSRGKRGSPLTWDE